MKLNFENKISLRYKFISIFIILLVVQFLIIIALSFFIFQKILDNEMSVLDFKANEFKSQIEKYYEEKTDVYKLPNLFNEYPDYDSSGNIKKDLDKKFPGMEFTINTIQGSVHYKENPKLIYDQDKKEYVFQIKRELNFKKKSEFQSLELSIKFNFYKVIFQSLLFSFLISFIIILPLLILFINKIVLPIIEISKASKKISKGNLGIQVDYKSNDEIGILLDSFNNMSKDLSKIKQVRDDLLATVSHELRSPLGRIRGYTELMLDIELQELERKMYYKYILQEVDLLNNMASEILEITRLELNKEKLYLEEIDMGFLFEILEEDLNIFKLKNNVDISFNYEYGIMCKIDSEKIKRVIVNIIQNSINAGANSILLKTNFKNSMYVIEIKDNGKGLEEDFYDLVFEKFYRMDKSIDRNTGGFGLGLAICKGIINEHNGKIYFKTPEDRIGACLVIELPVFSILKS